MFNNSIYNLNNTKTHIKEFSKLIHNIYKQEYELDLSQSEKDGRITGGVSKKGKGISLGLIEQKVEDFVVGLRKEIMHEVRLQITKELEKIRQGD